MAWEMQRDMHSLVAPSIFVEAQTRDDPMAWLAQCWANTVWEKGDDWDAIIRSAVDDGEQAITSQLAQAAIEYATTENGGFAFYLNAHGDTVPWCSDDELGAWYG
jgi:hypothetical protein